MRTALALIGIVIGFSLTAQDYSLDKKLGDENSRLVEHQIGLYKHDSLQWLVNAVGQKLVSRLKSKPFEFHFYIADSKEPNAFALPGGYVYVTRGILPLIQSEDELAGVLAHEIIHIMQRHSVKQLKKSAFTGILKLPGNMINAVTGTRIGNILNAPISLATASYISKYSRGNESEADKFGIQLAASAGYKTDALADALERLAESIRLVTGEAERHNYFSDHPYTPSRVAAIRSGSGNFKPVNPSSILSTRQSFISAFNGLCFGPNPEQGIFLDSVFLHPDLGFSWFIPPKWISLNNPSVAAAIQEKGEAILALQVTDGTKSPKTLGEETREQAAKASGLTVLQARDTAVHSLPAYILKLKSVQEGGTAFLEIIWLKYQQNVFQLTGLTLPGHTTNVHRSLTSFRPITDVQRKLVKISSIQVVRSNEDETIEELTQRTNNRLSVEITALINNCTTKSPIPKGSRIKIVNEENYKPVR